MELALAQICSKADGIGIDGHSPASVLGLIDLRAGDIAASNQLHAHLRIRLDAIQLEEHIAVEVAGQGNHRVLPLGQASWKDHIGEDRGGRKHHVIGGTCRHDGDLGAHVGVIDRCDFKGHIADVLDQDIFGQIKAVAKGI